MALDARYLKKHQRMLGGLYQSVLRSELTQRLGVRWGPIVKGQAEIAGMPTELLSVFSKRAAAIDDAMSVRLDEFRDRTGREPSPKQRAALEREASADTRGRKSGLGVADLATRWQDEAAEIGWTVERLVEHVQQAAAERSPTDALRVSDVVEAVSSEHSSWGRPDVIQAICDLHRPVSQMSGLHWAAAIERGVDKVLDRCVDLDPPDATQRRDSDGRSVWIEPTAPRFTSQAVLVEEERIVTWALDAQVDPASSSSTVDQAGLDVFQTDAAASVAGDDRLVLVVGPAGAGKTRMLAAAVADLHAHHRPVFGVAPTAKAARVLERDTGMRADTVAKLLHEWLRPNRPPRPEYQLRAGTTVVVDEAGMLSTPALYPLVTLAEAHQWRLALVGDDRQLQAVGRGGLFAKLCANGRVEQLEHLHRFTHDWEATASLQLRCGDPRALDAYEANDRIIPGTLAEHLAAIADRWVDHHRRGDTVALVASTNDHVDAINQAVQAARVAAGDLDDTAVSIADGECAHVGDVVATRRNDRTLITSAGEQVRNRETWTVTAVGTDGSLTVTREWGHGTVTVPADYAHDHVRLGYAATEHGYQSDTVDHAIALVSSVTTRRGLYVAATRGRDSNALCVVTDSDDVTEARDLLEAILAYDRADVPALTQRRTLAHQQPAEAARQRPEPTSRCDIPRWFEALRAELRHDLYDAEQGLTADEAKRARLAAGATAAQRDLVRSEAATAPARQALSAATSRYDEAWRRRARAQDHLDHSGIRGRRAARRHRDAAATKLEAASEHLERTRRHTAADVEHHRQTRTRADETGTALHRHLMHRRLNHSVDHVAALRRQVESLALWDRWAGGDAVNVHQLGDLVEQLTSVSHRDEHADQLRALGQAVRDWAGDAGIDLPTATRHSRILHRAGPELGL
jgi:hypothetical protein